jgi:hypothetical protein
VADVAWIPNGGGGGSKGNGNSPDANENGAGAGAADDMLDAFYSASTDKTVQRTLIRTAQF